MASFLSDRKVEDAAFVAGTGPSGLVGDHLQLLRGSVAGPAQLKASRDSMLRISLAALGWLGLILSQPRYGDAVPWLYFLLAVGTVALARFLHLRQELSKYYCVQTQAKWELHTYISHFFLASCLLAFAVCAAGFWHWPLVPHSRYSRQVVDIELVSPADVVNRNELLPATSLDLKSLRKVSPSVSFAKALRQASFAASSSSSPSSASSSEFLLPSAVSSASKPSSSLSKPSSSASKPSSSASKPSSSQSKPSSSQSKPSSLQSKSAQIPMVAANSQSVSSLGAKVDFKLFAKPEVMVPTKSGAGTDYSHESKPESQHQFQSRSQSPAQHQSIAPDNFAEPFVTPRGWKTITVSQAVSGNRSAQSATVRVSKERTGVNGVTSPILSEVTARDMIESIDSDGEQDDTVGHVNFTGGRSVGGKGAPSELAEFLKALNRRIKRYWQPPPGVQRAAQVEFLINHNGSLAGFKILESSGDRVTDRSIAQAIEKTFPFQALPTSYKNPTLMVHYSFRYNKLNGDGLVE